jgi:hypothetical protein
LGDSYSTSQDQTNSLIFSVHRVSEQPVQDPATAADKAAALEQRAAAKAALWRLDGPSHVLPRHTQQL